MAFKHYLTCLSLVLSGLGATVPSERSADMAGFSSRTRVGIRGESRIQLQLALKQSNVDKAAEELLKISDPTSAQYGQHWTTRRVARAFAPEPDHVSSVRNWLARSGVSTRHISSSHAGGHLLVALTVDETQVLLNTTCRQTKQEGDDHDWIDCGPYNVPPSVASALDYVAVLRKSKAPSAGYYSGREIISAPYGRSRWARDGGSSCDQYTSPACLRELYNIPQGTTPHPNNTFGVFEIAWLTWLPDDLDLFFDLFQPDLVGQRPVIQRVDGGYQQTLYNITPFNLEPNLDFQYTMALTSPQRVTNVQVGDQLLGGNINDMLAAFDKYYCGALDPSVDPVFPASQPEGYNHTTDCGTVEPPNVLSISFTYPEASFSPEYLRRQCLEFLKLGLMGVTVIVSSGDTGTQSGAAPGTCIDATTGASNATTGRFSPQWPSACPWVTSVGGTQRQPPSNSSTSVRETAFTYSSGGKYTYTSSGGFSNVFPEPVYQLAAVSEYRLREGTHLAALEASGNLASGSHGRGFPDVAMMASAYLLYLYGQLTTAYGTSASAPVFASMVAMINNDRLNASKRPVGFLNPVIYAHPETLTDVTTGENVGCGAEPAFRATSGWDAVTGMGSPAYDKLHKVLMDLP